MIYAIKLVLAVGVLGALAAFLLRRSFEGLLTREQYKAAWTLLAVATFAAFMSLLAPVYFVALFFIAIWGGKHLGGGDQGKIGALFLLVIALPPLNYSIGGVGGAGGINNLIQLTNTRVLTVALLSGVAITHLFGRARAELGRWRWVDLAVFGYAVFRIALQVPHSTITTIARMIVEAVLDTVLPYYAISRGLKSKQDLRLCLSYMAVGLLFAAFVAVIEGLTRYNLYQGIQWVYGFKWQLTQELLRGGHLRAQAMTPQPIVLAFTLIIALGIWIHLHLGAWRAKPLFLTFAMLVAALVLTWSRGPWIGAICFGACLFALRRVSPATFVAGLLAFIGGGVVLKMMNADTAISAALGSVFGGAPEDLGSIDYRSQLLDTSLALIKQSPWFGVPNYAQSLQELKQGEGIIDLVNSYVAIALDAGIVGLALFLLPYVLILFPLLRAEQRQRALAPTSHDNFARVFAALIVSCLLTIFTTSTFFTMPFLLTMLIALPVAWLSSPVRETNPAPVRPVLSPGFAGLRG